MSSPLVTDIVVVIGVLLFTSVVGTRRRAAKRLQAAGHPLPAVYRVMSVCWIVVVLLAVVVIALSLIPGR
jgi:hypothetical protein